MSVGAPCMCGVCSLPSVESVSRGFWELKIAAQPSLAPFKWTNANFEGGSGSPPAVTGQGRWWPEEFRQGFEDCNVPYDLLKLVDLGVGEERRGVRGRRCR